MFGGELVGRGMATCMVGVGGTVLLDIDPGYSRLPQSKIIMYMNEYLVYCNRVKNVVNF